MKNTILRIRARCTDLGLSSDDFALKTNIPRSVAKALLGGDPTHMNHEDLLEFISLKDLPVFCEVLERSPRWLLFGKTPVKRNP